MEQRDRSKENTIPQGKRDEREGVDPKSQPAEFADDMRTNRFTPPPDPPDADEGENNR